MKVLLLIVSLLASFSYCGTKIIKANQFDQNVTSYLKRAVDASTIEIAGQNLQVAINYLESTGRTTGFTSVFGKAPDADVGYWYANLTATANEIGKVRNDITPSEKTHILINLRESLLDRGIFGDIVALPNDIAVFPDKRLSNAVGWFSFHV